MKFHEVQEVIDKLKEGGFECQGGPLENNIDFQKVQEHINDMQRIKEQNDRMRQWFEERTGTSNMMLSEQMALLDRRIDKLTTRFISLLSAAVLDEDKRVMIMKASPEFVKEARRLIQLSPL